MSTRELKEASSPLAELSQKYDILPERELNESLGKKALGVSNNEDDESDGPRRLTCINEKYSGQNHPETGVPYVEKTVKDGDGNEVTGVFPQFDSVFDAQLPDDLLQESDSKQFSEANRQLKEKYDSDPEFRSQFDERQRESIENGGYPYEYI